MSEAIKSEVLAAVEKWRPRLRLMDWSISYKWGAVFDDHNAAMSSDVQPRYRRLCLRVKDDTEDDHWQTVEKQVVHELCHAITEEPIDIAQDLMNAFQVGKLTFSAMDTAMRAANERATEWIARLLWEAHEGTAWDAELPLTKS